MAIRSDEITSIIKSAIDSFDAGVETRSVGTVVEVGDGIAHATATTAAKLTPEEVKALTERLERSTGRRVALDVEVDPSLLGGLVVRVGDRMIDGSVRGRLERLRNQLVSGAL